MKPEPPLASVWAERLRCESCVNPLAIIQPHPRLSWIVEARERSQRQSAYQVLVSESLEGLGANGKNLWDSGKVVSDETIGIEYAGKALKPLERCWWKVRLWDGLDRVSGWSSPAFFGGGLSQSDWRAEWVGLDQARNFNLPPAPFEEAKWIWLDKHSAENGAGTFVGLLHLPEDVGWIDSQIAISVAGNYRFYWGAEQFAKGDSEPESWRRPYIRHMNERLQPGSNRFVIWAEKKGDEVPALLFKAKIRAADGRMFTLVSDEMWLMCPGGLADGAKIASDSGALFDPLRKWQASRVIAQYGDQPWGHIQGTENFLPPPTYLRKEFTVRKKVTKATLFATALGAYDLHLNGQRVNESYFDPGWTDYRKRLYYRAFEVTHLIQPHRNALGAVLADGWFSGYIGWGHQRDVYGKHPRFRAQLHIKYTDETWEIVKTDCFWQGTAGPIKEADMLMGEYYDARDELEGWSLPGYDDSGWKPVDVGARIEPLLQPHPAPPVVALTAETFAARSICQPKKGIFVVDLGQNFSGIVRLRVRRPRSGQKITLRFGERLEPDGSLYTKNLRTARATDTYVCAGLSEEEVWSPRFTFHGFQFVEITGLPSVDSETIIGIPLSSDTPLSGTFHCSDELINRLASNIYWSQRSNFLEIPMDCPQRDERLGWCDVAWTFLYAGALRADLQTFYGKWLTDLMDAQAPDGLFPWLAPFVVTTPEDGGPQWAQCSPCWSDAGVIVPWSIYCIYGDRRQLEDHYPAMVRQVEWYRRNSLADLSPLPDHKCLGDWLHHEAPISPDVFRTLFFAHSTDLVSRAAALLNRDQDAARYRKLFQELKFLFQRKFVHRDGKISGDTQSAYAFALFFDLLTEEQGALAEKWLTRDIEQRGHATTGTEATLPLMLILARIGRNDLAYRLLHYDGLPSWKFSIKSGATTIWERWDSWTKEKGFADPAMNSFNHFSLGAVYQWMAENIGGIRSDDVAYKKLILAPTPGGKLTYANVSHDSVRGLIRSEWRVENNTLDLKVLLPPNILTTLILPATTVENVTESGCPLSQSRDFRISGKAQGKITLEIGSGLYRFRIKRPVLI